MSVRGKKKRAAAACRGSKGQTRGKSRGFKVLDGEFVHQGQTLVTQLHLQVYPGQFVDTQKDNTLVSMSDGRVVISWEKLQPYPDSPLYQPIQQGVEIVRQFCHIIPTPLHGKFRLISQV